MPREIDPSEPTPLIGNALLQFAGVLAAAVRGTMPSVLSCGPSLSDHRCASQEPRGNALSVDATVMTVHPRP
jgi:hypothetical protein